MGAHILNTLRRKYSDVEGEISMTVLHRFSMIGGIIHISIGGILEILYWTVLKDLVWILLIYPPSLLYILIQILPIIGILFILVGIGWLILSFWLYLMADLEYLRKINQFSN